MNPKLQAISARIDAYERLVRLDRPIGILLLLWPTLWALWLARHALPPLAILWIFVLGTAVMRSAGCAFNDWADRGYDAYVERTQARPLATGEIRPWEALVVAAVLAACAFVLILRLNALTIWLSFAGLAVAVVYPFLKRFFWMPQAWLGIAFGFGIPMGFAALTNSVPPLAWALLAANICWTIAYDTEYAMVDRDDDIRVGAKSTAILFGDADLPILGVLMVSFLGTMALVAQRGHLHKVYFIGRAAAALLFVWQQWIMRQRDRDACFAAFRNNNWVGLVLWVGIVMSLALN